MSFDFHAFVTIAATTISEAVGERCSVSGYLSFICGRLHVRVLHCRALGERRVSESCTDSERVEAATPCAERVRERAKAAVLEVAGRRRRWCCVERGESEAQRLSAGLMATWG